MNLSILKETWELLCAIVRTIDRVAVLGAKSMLRVLGSALLVGAGGLLLVVLSTTYLQATSSEDQKLRKEPERSLAADERFLVAQEALIACDEAQKAKRKTVKEACAEAVRRYKHAMSEAMSPVLLQERLKTETVSNWLLDVNEALRLQRERRASRAPPTFTEHIHSWTSTYWGYAALVAVLILPLLARHAWVTNKEQEKEKAKLTKKTTQYHYPLRKPAPVGTRQRTRLRSNRSRQAMAT